MPSEEDILEEERYQERMAEKGYDTLMQAAMGDTLENVQLLLKRGHRGNYKNYRGMSAVDYAVERGNVEIAAAIVHADESPAKVAGASLWFAALVNDCAMVQMLLDAGGDVNLVHHDQFEEEPSTTPLMVTNDPEIVRMLIDAGARYNDSVAGIIPLNVAVRNGHDDMVERMLASKPAGRSAREDIGYASALYSAMKLKKYTIIEALLAAGADISANGRSSSGASPLMRYCRSSDEYWDSSDDDECYVDSFLCRPSRVKHPECAPYEADVHRDTVIAMVLDHVLLHGAKAFTTKAAETAQRDAEEEEDGERCSKRPRAS